ncbi:hypothetical protein FYC62_06880 [Pedobacter aquae]|uniref:Uncharacterized protein n=2 Tax=Pedobacter aquae TaxID=2605747 RepID=A0A5C0VJN2_9SPHI|nr:hypothetical protein FYC62_06880 [Pedobacter aquae]
MTHGNRDYRNDKTFNDDVILSRVYHVLFNRVILKFLILTDIILIIVFNIHLQNLLKWVQEKFKLKKMVGLSIEQGINQVMGGKHIVILGAGASIASTSRNAERQNKVLPYMLNFFEVLRIKRYCS